MSNILNTAQIIISITLITTILLQQRGSGLSGIFGGEGNVYRTKRGFEKLLFYSTIILVALFIGSALFRIIFKV